MRSGHSSRREFLARTAALAGTSAILPAPALLNLAAQKQAMTSGLPSPGNVPIDHVVDPDDGEPVVRPLLRLDRRHRARRRHPAPDLHATRTATTSHTLHHSELGDRRQRPTRAAAIPIPATAGTPAARSCEGGFIAEGSGNDVFALTYFDEGELGFIHDAAKTFTLYDSYFTAR